MTLLRYTTFSWLPGFPDIAILDNLCVFGVCLFILFLHGGFLTWEYPQIIHFDKHVHMFKPSSYWGSAMTMEPPHMFYDVPQGYGSTFAAGHELCTLVPAPPEAMDLERAARRFHAAWPGSTTTEAGANGDSPTGSRFLEISGSTGSILNPWPSASHDTTISWYLMIVPPVFQMFPDVPRPFQAFRQATIFKQFHVLTAVDYRSCTKGRRCQRWLHRRFVELALRQPFACGVVCRYAAAFAYLAQALTENRGRRRWLRYLDLDRAILCFEHLDGLGEFRRVLGVQGIFWTFGWFFFGVYLKPISRIWMDLISFFEEMVRRSRKIGGGCSGANPIGGWHFLYTAGATTGAIDPVPWREAFQVSACWHDSAGFQCLWEIPIPIREMKLPQIQHWSCPISHHHQLWPNSVI